MYVKKRYKETLGKTTREMWQRNNIVVRKKAKSESKYRRKECVKKRQEKNKK